MKVLYVTTFNEKLYNISGKNMINSFFENISSGDLLVCHENIDVMTENERLIKYDLNESSYMHDWLNNNMDNIPKFYGGNAENGDDRFLLDKSKGQSWARFRASCYFKKICALEIALKLYEDQYDIIFLVDCDCVFKKDITEKITDIFQDDIGYVYFWGDYRKKINRGPETGFTGFNKKNNGYEFARIICDCFSSGKFLDYEYWDDGFVIGRLIMENKDKGDVVFKDLVTSSSRTTRVMETPNILNQYIHHNKNIHFTKDEQEWI